MKNPIDTLLDHVATFIHTPQARIVLERYRYSGRDLPARFKEGDIVYEFHMTRGADSSTARAFGLTLEEACAEALESLRREAEDRYEREKKMREQYQRSEEAALERLRELRRFA